MQRWLVFFFSAVLIAGCASQKLSPESVSTQISNAELMISQAKQNRAEEYAPLELRLAEEKLQEARKALKDEETDMAGRKAEMAMEHARLAEAKAQAGKAKKQAQKEQKDVDILRNEIDRAQKVKP
ncbi:MAG: DUF4398 domain-containing protein [Desulfococcaceae bacterium]